MIAHVMDIEVRPNGVLEYRWICAAGCKPGKWSTSALAARRGGVRHVAAMERGR